MVWLRVSNSILSHSQRSTLSYTHGGVTPSNHVAATGAAAYVADSDAGMSTSPRLAPNAQAHDVLGAFALGIVHQPIAPSSARAPPLRDRPAIAAGPSSRQPSRCRVSRLSSSVVPLEQSYRRSTARESARQHPSVFACKSGQKAELVRRRASSRCVRRRPGWRLGRGRDCSLATCYPSMLLMPQRVPSDVVH